MFHSVTPLWLVLTYLFGYCACQGSHILIGVLLHTTGCGAARKWLRFHKSELTTLPSTVRSYQGQTSASSLEIQRLVALTLRVTEPFLPGPCFHWGLLWVILLITFMYKCLYSQMHSLTFLVNETPEPYGKSLFHFMRNWRIWFLFLPKACTV